MKTKKEILAWMKNCGMSGVVIRRMDKMMDQFATLDHFFDAKRGDLLKAYRDIAPKGVHGLGRTFWDLFGIVSRYYKTGESFKRQEDPQACENHDGEHQANQAKASEIDTRLVRMISYRDLKAVVDMMEILDIEALNMIEIAGFLQSVRFRQKKPEPEREEKREETKAE